MTIEHALETGHAFDALLGINGFFIPSRYLEGHEHLTILYCMNALAVRVNDPNRFIPDIDRAFVHLVGHQQYQQAMDLLTALHASQHGQKDWILRVPLTSYARMLSPFLDRVNASDEFKQFVALASATEQTIDATSTPNGRNA